MKAIGGNSGYIGYSESVRSYNAKKEGKYPKTLFKKEYGITEKKFKELEERGVISISEWHHTSKFGNKTDFWAVNDFVLFYLLKGEKEKAYNCYKNSKKNIGYKYTYNKKSRENARKILNEATEIFIGKVEIGENVIYKGVKLECFGKTKHRKAPYFKFITQKTKIQYNEKF